VDLQRAVRTRHTEIIQQLEGLSSKLYTSLLRLKHADFWLFSRTNSAVAQDRDELTRMEKELESVRGLVVQLMN
jgi:division protein CdvB (Snf7/Vps24/ESCRT-III family)